MSAGLRPIDLDVVNAVVRNVCDECVSISKSGKSTQDVGALSEIDPNLFGIAGLTRDGDLICGGKVETAFLVQCLSKVFTLALALEHCGEKLWERLGRNSSGDPFNSIIDLERHEGHPRNPFINAGALVVVDVLLDQPGPEEEIEAVIDFVSQLLDRADVTTIEKVAESNRSGARQSCFGELDQTFWKPEQPYRAGSRNLRVPVSYRAELCAAGTDRLPPHAQRPRRGYFTRQTNRQAIPPDSRDHCAERRLRSCE